VQSILPGHIKRTPFQEGPRFGRKPDLLGFAAFPENAERLTALNKRLKLYRGEDGWFASGRSGQLWEYGVGKLGFTVGSALSINRMIAAGFKIAQHGDEEANFSCEWSEDCLERLIKLLRLKKRSGGYANPFQLMQPMTREGKIPAPKRELERS
jgi:hypothetical protein